jgi:spore coat polysaccharide biosynthesis protein SpsF
MRSLNKKYYKNFKIGLIFQARANSSRLKKKIFKKINKKTILELFIRRIKKIKKIEHIIAATTRNVEDNKTVLISKINRINVYRGSEKNVLSRFFHAAKKYKLDLIIRCNADCPFIDPKLINKMLDNYNNRYDYYSNILIPTFPSGMHIEIIKFNALKKAYKLAKKKIDKEHVTSFIYNNPKLFTVANYRNSKNLSFHRWTLDFNEDFLFIKKIYKEMNYREDFDSKDIMKLLKKKPNIMKINYHIEKKQNLITR